MAHLALSTAQGLAHSRASNPGRMVVGWDLLLTAPSSQEEKEKRRLEQLERKKETQRLLEEEDSKLKGGKAPRVAVPSKVTRAQIEETLRRDHQHKETQEPGVEGLLELCSYPLNNRQWTAFLEGSPDPLLSLGEAAWALHGEG